MGEALIYQAVRYGERFLPPRLLQDESAAASSTKSPGQHRDFAVRFAQCIAASVTALVTMAASMASMADTIKLGYIDPFTGPVASINENQFNSLKFVVDMANREGWADPHTFEVVGIDSKGSAQESVLQLKAATDRGIRYIVQGLGSAVAAALIESINKYNDRHPGGEVLYLTPSGLSTELTNERCSFWLFRFNTNVAMRTEGLTTLMARDNRIKRVYLVNQNYETGQQTSVAARANLQQKRPDIEIVGDDLHPLFQVKDFSPYVAKIKASRADAVITSNMSTDLTLLIKAAKEAGLKVPFFTFHAATKGVPSALAAAHADNVHVVTYWNPGDNPAARQTLLEPFKAKYADDFAVLPFYTMVRMVSQAIKQAGSAKPLAVAKAMEGMRLQNFNGEVQMRKSDHQLQQPLVLASWAKVDGKYVHYDHENTGYGFKTIGKVDAYASSLPTSCRMKRPAEKAP